MASVKQILQTIIDHPGWSGAQLADELEIDAKDIQPRIDSYIRQGKVIRDKKVIDGSSPINLYYPSDDLVREFDGTKRLVQKDCLIRLKMFQQTSEHPSLRNAS